MMHNGQRVADFCHYTGEEFITANGVREHWHICRKHGRMSMIQYFGFATAPPVLTCPKCLEEYLEKALTEAEEPEYTGAIEGFCETCGLDTDLEDCKICGSAHCPAHITNEICFECNRGRVKSTKPACAYCAESNNLEECEICGKSACPTHRIETVCEDCADGITEFRKGWAGV